ncbi:hypothetical protein TcasGA2_TC033851 [Tribolium castaneum]|uniref:Uncharacterized protein n=2 Tax=Tribolium castaneum TaxID=7070 RepID=A0A139WF09_TRICA|nr:hypothetical protein TcasGA2_TC033851 [Tribolium castaneum]
MLVAKLVQQTLASEGLSLEEEHIRQLEEEEVHKLVAELEDRSSMQEEPEVRKATSEAEDSSNESNYYLDELKSSSSSIRYFNNNTNMSKFVFAFVVLQIVLIKEIHSCALPAAPALGCGLPALPALPPAALMALPPTLALPALPALPAAPACAPPALPPMQIAILPLPLPAAPALPPPCALPPTNVLPMKLALPPLAGCAPPPACC